MMAESKDQINRGKPRTSYLITYSQADSLKFPTQESFALAVVDAFISERNKVKPQYWACCLEKHSDNDFFAKRTKRDDF